MQNVLAGEQQQVANALNTMHDSEGDVKHLVTMIICSKMENCIAEPKTKVFIVGGGAVGNTFPTRIECRETTGFFISTKWVINRNLYDLLPRRQGQRLRYALVLKPFLPYEQWTSRNLQFPQDTKKCSFIKTNSVRLQSSKSGECTLYANRHREQFLCFSPYKVWLVQETWAFVILLCKII